MSPDGGNVPLQLKRVLAALHGDHKQHVSQQDFLHCLDRNGVRRKTYTALCFQSQALFNIS